MRTNELPKMVALGFNSDPKRAQEAVRFMNLVLKLEGVGTITRQQCYGSSVISAVMTTFDNAFDLVPVQEAHKNGRNILALIQGKTGTALDPLITTGISYLLENFNQRASEALGQLTTCQIASIEQRRSNINIDRVDTITRNKGASVALLFAFEANPNLPLKRQRCYQELGYFLQLIDDIKDQKQDNLDNIVTLATMNVCLVLEKTRTQYAKVHQLFSEEYASHSALGDMLQYIEILYMSIMRSQAIT